MLEATHYIPLATSVVSLVFGTRVLRRYLARFGEGESAPHLLWWALGIYTFGAGTLAESYHTLFGWNEANFRAWYITGALLGGWPLAQGTVYLLLPRNTAHFLTALVLVYIAVAASFVIVAPVNPPVSDAALTGRVFEWSWVRLFSPLVNTYAFLFLVGGAAYSAWLFRRNVPRAASNVLIAVGALLPGIGGSFSRAGRTEVLYVTEFVGLLLIFAGYQLAVRVRAGAPAKSPD